MNGRPVRALGLVAALAVSLAACGGATPGGSPTGLRSPTAGPTVSPTIACAARPEGLRSWWRAEGSAADAAGGRDGSVQGGTSFAKGSVGDAFVLDGTSGYVLVPHHPALNPSGSLTIVAWFRSTADRSGAIVRKWGDAGGWSNQRAYALLTVTGRRLIFGLADDAHQGDGAFHGFVTPNGVFELDKWTHVAAVYDHTTGTRRMLVNGVEVAQRTDPPFVITASVADVGIGAYLPAPAAPTEFFAGALDEVALFDRAVTAQEIQAIVAAGSAGMCGTGP